MRRTRAGRRVGAALAGRGRSGLRVGAVAAVATVAVALGLTACGLNPPEIVVYGDSLTSQAIPYIQHDLTQRGQADVVFNAYPGTAPCDWLRLMLSDARTDLMSAAVIEFYGNNYGCMSYPFDSPAFFAAYRSQVTQAVLAFASRGIHVFLIGAPVSLQEVRQRDNSWDHLNEIYAEIADKMPGVTFVNAGAAVEHDTSFTWTLPCQAGQPWCRPDHQAIVRASDGLHFCPQQAGDGSQCLDYSFGAARYAAAMTAPINTLLSGGSLTSYVGPPLPPSGTAPNLAPGQGPDPITSTRDALTGGQILTTGQALDALGGSYRATLQQDGNFVLYGPDGPLWSTNTTGSGADTLSMQADGNLVLYSGSRPVWNANTAGTGANYLALQDDGNLVLYDFNTPYWQSKTGSSLVGVAATGQRPPQSRH